MRDALVTPGFRNVLVAAALALAAPPAYPQGGLLPAGDEFDTPATWTQWSRVRAVEQWGADPVETWDIGVTTPGAMTLVPVTVTWYQDWTGPLAFRLVSGDFALTTRVRATGRDGASVPQAAFSLAGVMLRAPRGVTPATWSPGGENYVFLSIGHGATVPAAFEYEVKTTTNSASSLLLEPAGGPEATLQFARLGGVCLALRREPGGPWVVHHRYARPDLPDTLQAGLVGYTDWTKAGTFDPFVHNRNVLVPPLPAGVADPSPGLPFAPDLRATFEYARFARVQVPAPLAGLDLSDPGAVPDAALLAFLGDSANVPTPTVSVPATGLDVPRLVAGPNPSATGTELAFTLEAAGPVRLDVLDVRGARVRRLAGSTLGAGRHRLRWDGADDAGRPAAPGLYFARLEAGAWCAVVRLARLAGR